MCRWSIESAGTDALIIRFGDAIAPERVSRIRSARVHLSSALGDRIYGLIPSYTTLMVHYCPANENFQSIAREIDCLLQKMPATQLSKGNLLEIPVWYAAEVGPDLARIAQLHQISTDEVIARHSEREYQVYAIGFAPGFAYLGDVDPTLATPRLATPRDKVPAGSVALADRQTAVYPITTPGGWNILGRTALRMFDPSTSGLCPLSAGDRVRFVPVSRAQFVEAGGTI